MFGIFGSSSWTTDCTGWLCMQKDILFLIILLVSYSNVLIREIAWFTDQPFIMFPLRHIFDFLIKLSTFMLCSQLVTMHAFVCDHAQLCCVGSLQLCMHQHVICTVSF